MMSLRMHTNACRPCHSWTTKSQPRTPSKLHRQSQMIPRAQPASEQQGASTSAPAACLRASAEFHKPRLSELCTMGVLASLATSMPAEAQVLDASGAHVLADFLRPLFTFFTFLYIVRIPMTWYPTLDVQAFPWNLAYGPTEPILSVTRKVVPLVGGVDVTPIVWVGLLSFFSEILLGPQGLLILIERQGGF